MSYLWYIVVPSLTFFLLELDGNSSHSSNLDSLHEMGNIATIQNNLHIIMAAHKKKQNVFFKTMKILNFKACTLVDLILDTGIFSAQGWKCASALFESL